MTTAARKVVVRLALRFGVGLVALGVSQAQPASPLVPTPQQKKYALVIGITGYASLEKDAKLRYADRDATDFAAFIQTVQGGAFPAENVHLVTNKFATRDRIFSEFHWLQTAGPNDLVYVFFAGHGDNYGGVSYFLPVNASRDTLDSQGIPMNEFFRKVTSDLLAKQIVVIIDACGSAGAVQGARGSGEEEKQKEWEQRKAKEGQLAMALFSSLASEKSWEDPDLGGGHGLFTWYLLEGMRGAAERTSEGFITAASLLAYVRQEVEARSLTRFRSLQTPFNSPDFRPDFPMAYSTAPPPVRVDSPSFGIIQVSSINRGVIYIDGKQMGQIFESGRSTFQKQTVGETSGADYRNQSGIN